MPAPSVDLNDDASIARLLAADARASSSRYASHGLSALLPQRATGSAPKPNTRFLKALVRDADSHNAALRRKEDRERVTRLRNGGQRSTDRSESLAQPTDNGRERKRRRIDEGRDNHTESSHRLSDPKPRRRRRSGSDSRVRSRSRSPSRKDGRRRRHRDRHTDDSPRSRHDRDSSVEKLRESSHRKHRRRRSRSDERATASSEEPRSLKADEKRTKRRQSSSDPLEDIVGPLPAKDLNTSAPIRVRGRGAHKLTSTSNIDAHFSSTYDPSLDVQPEIEAPDEKEDWDMALEALRDRQAWKKKHADRMRAAGFGDDEIEKWEASGREKDARDVRWRGKGQTREWDVGKDQQSSDGEDREGRLTP